MDRWMDGWVDGWVGGWMDGWVGGWVGGWVDEWMKKRKCITYTRMGCRRKMKNPIRASEGIHK